MLADGVLPVPSRADVRADLEALAGDFGRLFATDCECHLRTDRRYWPSRFVGPNEAILPKCFRRNDTDDWEQYLSGDGLRTDPVPVRSADDVARAPVFYDRAGRPVVNSAGQSMIMAPGWDSDHEIKLRGPGSLRAAETIERANDLAFDVARLLASILWPGRSLTFRAFGWPDVVDAVADLANRSTLKSADWYVMAGLQPYSVDVWRRRADFEFGVAMVPDAIADLIGDDPENVWAVRRAFLRDSETVARWLIEALAEPVGDPAGDEIEADDRGDQGKPSADGLSDDGRNLYWGGGVYPIGPGCVGVIRLLVDSFYDGKPYLSQDYLMTEGECQTELRTVAKNNKLDGVLVRQKNPDGRAVKGMWGLVDPEAIKKKTSTH